MEAIVFINLQIFFATGAIFKIGEYLTIIPWERVGYNQSHIQQTRMETPPKYLTIRLQARVFYEQIVNEAQPSWLSLVENEGE